MHGENENAEPELNDGGGRRGREDDTLVDVHEAARMCKVSVSMFYKMSRTGRTPGPIKLGKLLRWKKRELAEWIHAGCPPIVK